jgi:hypothetical protein
MVAFLKQGVNKDEIAKAIKACRFTYYNKLICIKQKRSECNARWTQQLTKECKKGFTRQTKLIESVKKNSQKMLLMNHF